LDATKYSISTCVTSWRRASSIDSFRVVVSRAQVRDDAMRVGIEVHEMQ